MISGKKNRSIQIIIISIYFCIGITALSCKSKSNPALSDADKIINAFIDFRKNHSLVKHHFEFFDTTINLFTESAQYYLYDQAQSRRSHGIDGNFESNREHLLLLEKFINYANFEVKFISDSIASLTYLMRIPDYKTALEKDNNRASIADVPIIKWEQILSSSYPISLKRTIFYQKIADDWKIRILPPNLYFPEKERELICNSKAVISSQLLSTKRTNLPFFLVKGKGAFIIIDSNADTGTNILKIDVSTLATDTLYKSNIPIFYSFIDTNNNRIFFFEHENGDPTSDEPNYLIGLKSCNFQTKQRDIHLAGIRVPVGNFRVQTINSFNIVIDIDFKRKLIINLGDNSFKVTENNQYTRSPIPEQIEIGKSQAVLSTTDWGHPITFSLYNSDIFKELFDPLSDKGSSLRFDPITASANGDTVYIVFPMMVARYSIAQLGLVNDKLILKTKSGITILKLNISAIDSSMLTKSIKK